jgi:hypothetical protein
MAALLNLSVLSLLVFSLNQDWFEVSQRLGDVVKTIIVFDYNGGKLLMNSQNPEWEVMLDKGKIFSVINLNKNKTEILSYFNFLKGLKVNEALDILKYSPMIKKIRPLNDIDVMFCDFTHNRLNVYTENGKIKTLSHFG